MIDWLTISIPFLHNECINNGFIISVSPEGSTEWLTEKSRVVQGSHMASLQIRSEEPCGDDLYSRIRLSGNVVKFLQGHNVWGSDQLFDLALCAFMRVFELIQLPFDPQQLAHSVYQGRITRVDLTENYDVGSETQASEFLYALERSATLRHRGAGKLDRRGTTLYFGKHSRRWALKVYLKYQELLAHKPKLISCPDDLPKVTNYAKGLVRFEVVLRGKELDGLGLGWVFQWDNCLAADVYNRYLSKLNCSENMKTSAHLPSLEGLPARLVAVVNLWYEGHDLKTMYPRATFYRYKAEVKKHLNLDISIAPPNGKKGEASSNVIPLIRVLEAQPKPIPEWAYGSDLFFEPPSYRALLK